jgi:Nucleotidyl transferase AbiEii toxin, Type IV TA system
VNEPRYKTEEDFRRALEARLYEIGDREARGLVRERQVLVFERFLARAVVADEQIVIKGGMALELRTTRARSTRDIDLRVMGHPDQFERTLDELARTELGDYLRFRIQPHGRPDIEAIGMKYPGKRYRVQAVLAGRQYGDPFGVDAAFGEPIFGTPERIKGRSDLSFIGVPAPELAVYPRATHVAEKLHAYTVPRPTPNSRVRDLPDLAILATVGPMDSEVLRGALGKTFAHRGTHAVPRDLAEAPERWRAPYHELAASNRLPWTSLEEVHQAVRAFLAPALAGERGLWDPTIWGWEPARV